MMGEIGILDSTLIRIWMTRSDDIQDVKLMQVVSCPIDGEWDLNRRKPLYVVKNSDVVSDIYEKLF